MKDDFQEFERMKSEGIDARTAYLYSRQKGMDHHQQIRMLRSVYSVSLAEAKEVSVTADGSFLSLNDYQEKIIHLALKAALEACEPKKESDLGQT